jgi:hypothetical protein
MRIRHALLALAVSTLTLAPVAALACGYCVEDKIAAVYDHAVITRALDRRHQVAFFAIEGEPVAEELSRALRVALEKEGAVDRGSIRVSPASGALSFAYDPARRGLGLITSMLDRRIASQRSTLSLLKVIAEGDRAMLSASRGP